MDAEALAAAGEAALEREELLEAIGLLHHAEAAGALPDRCAGNRWMAHMLGGNFGAAWLESDAIRSRGLPDPHRFWLGEDLCGKRVMLRSLHGFGDAIQLLRFLPRLRAIAAEVIVEVAPALRSLAPCFDGVGQVITWGSDAPRTPPAWDVQCEVMELPYLLRIGADDLEPTQGYLHLPEDVRLHTARGMGPRVGQRDGPRSRPRVGVVWASGLWNTARSLPAGALRVFVQHGDCEFWSLQGRGVTTEAAPPGWHDHYAMGDDLLSLAAVIEQMDLVISVDTMVPHLAGALGVPCWLLLQQRADWRWMVGREDTPWYPSVRLWRQRGGEGWEGLLDRVSGALGSWTEDWRRKHGIEAVASMGCV